jgi:S-ribosylhomocysteine lyase
MQNQKGRKPMGLIASFQVDHTKIVPGIYESRVDEIGDDFATTFDIRMKTPNKEPAIHPNAMHTIEHVVATFLRNDAEWKDRIVYWGPMGCLTGCYLIVKGRPKPQELQPLLLRAFEYLRDYEGEVPGATPVNCGNYLLHDLPMAKWEAARYVEILKTRACYEYGMTKRLDTTGGVFYDS